MQARLSLPPLPGGPFRKILKRFLASVVPGFSRLSFSRNSMSLSLELLRHELRTPLVGILGMSELLYQSMLNREQRLLLLALQESAKQMNHLVGGLSIGGGPMASGSISQVRSFAAEEFLEQIVRAHWITARDKGIDLHLMMDSRLPSVWISDPPGLRQVLDNLLGNAVKFTNQGFVLLEALLTHVANGEPGRLALRVTDTGPGIAPRDQNRIYAMHEQGNEVAGIYPGSSGIGLAICSHLAKRLGATIGHEPYPGGGMRFTLSLPLIEGDTASKAFQIQPRLLSGQRCLILLRDPWKSVVQNLLGRMGVRAELADKWSPQGYSVPFDAVFCESAHLSERGWSAGAVEQLRGPLVLWHETPQGWQTSDGVTGCRAIVLPQPLLRSSLEPLLLQLALQRKLRQSPLNETADSVL